MSAGVTYKVGDQVIVRYLGTELKGTIVGFRLMDYDDVGAASALVKLDTAKGSTVYIQPANIVRLYTAPI
jgi:hypothetical protein